MSDQKKQLIRDTDQEKITSETIEFFRSMTKSVIKVYLDRLYYRKLSKKDRKKIINDLAKPIEAALKEAREDILFDYRKRWKDWGY